jgi:hypothetical protein
LYLVQLLIATCNQYGLVVNILPPDICFLHWRNLPYFSHFTTYCMKQVISWEVKRFSGHQETPHILWNPKVHYHIYKCLPPATILSKINPIIVQSLYDTTVIKNVFQAYRNTTSLSQGKLAESCITLSVLRHAILNSFALCLIYSGQCSWEMI